MIKALRPLVLGRSKVKCPPQARTSPKYNHGFQGPWPTNSGNFIKICSQHFQLFCKQSDKRLSHTVSYSLGRGNYTTLNDNKPNAFVTTMPWWLEKLKEDQSQSGWVNVSWSSLETNDWLNTPIRSSISPLFKGPGSAHVTARWVRIGIDWNDFQQETAANKWSLNLLLKVSVSWAQRQEASALGTFATILIVGLTLLRCFYL